MPLKAVYVPCIILGGVWLTYIVYFARRKIKRKVNNYFNRI